MESDDGDDDNGAVADVLAEAAEDETGPADAQPYVREARAVAAVKRDVLASNLRRLQVIVHTGDATAGWDDAVAALRRAADAEAADNVEAAPASAIVTAISSAVSAVDDYCRDSTVAEAITAELAARAKTASDLIQQAAAGLPRRAPGVDSPPPLAGKKQRCSRCGQPGHKFTTCQAATGTPQPALSPARDPQCADCLGGGHAPGDASCPEQRQCGGNKAAYDRGVNPSCSDPLGNRGRQTRAVVVPVAFLARKVFDDGGSGAMRVAVANTLRAELEALAEASTKLRFLMLRVVDVALRHLATLVTGDDWAGALPTDWQPVWLWLSYACGCTGVTGSPSRANAACGVL